MRRNRYRMAIAVVASAALGGLAACEPSPPPITFMVNLAGDAPDSQPGDGVCEVNPGHGDCSLRAAVQEGDAVDGPAIIRFDPAVRSVALPGGSLDVNDTTTIEGPALVNARIIQTGGRLVLRDLTLASAGGDAACGTAIRSIGGSLGLDEVEVRFGGGGGTTQPLLCTSGPLTLLDTMIDGLGRPTAVVSEGPTIVYGSSIGAATAGLDVAGASSFWIANTSVEGLRTGDASGTVISSWLTGDLGAGTTVQGSILDCRPGSTVVSNGYNLDVAGTCGANDPTDQAPTTRPPTTIDLTRPPMILPAEAVGSPAIDAIPAGTPGLCDGTLPTDQKGAPRPGDEPCDIGPIEYQASITAGSEAARDVVTNTPVRVNASGTVAATFPGEDGAPDAVGRWEADGTFTSSGLAGSRVSDIADDGTVVGSVLVDGSRHAWRWHPDGTSELVTGPTGTTAGELFAIDDRDGTVVGRTYGADGPLLWWLAPGGSPTPLPVSGTDPIVTSVRDGIAVGHDQAWIDIATVWDLSAGTTTALPDIVEGDPEGRNTDSYALDVTPDGTVLGEIDGDIVVWPGGGSPTLRAEFTAPLTAGVAGSVPIVVGRGNVEPDSSILYVLGEHATDVRLVVGLVAEDLGDGGHLVGTRQTPGGSFTSRQVVRLPLTLTP